MRWSERTVLYVYLTLLTGWVYLQHRELLNLDKAVSFLFTVMTCILNPHGNW